MPKAGGILVGAKDEDAVCDTSVGRIVELVVAAPRPRPWVVPVPRTKDDPPPSPEEVVIPTVGVTVGKPGFTLDDAPNNGTVETAPVPKAPLNKLDVVTAPVPSILPNRGVVVVAVPAPRVPLRRLEVVVAPAPRLLPNNGADTVPVPIEPKFKPPAIPKVWPATESPVPILLDKPNEGVVDAGVVKLPWDGGCPNVNGFPEDCTAGCCIPNWAGVDDVTGAALKALDVGISDPNRLPPNWLCPNDKPPPNNE